MPQRADKKRFLKLSLLFAVPVDVALLLIGQFGSEEVLRYYTDFSTLVLLGIAVSILLMLIPRATDRTLRSTTALIAAGFVLQIAFSLVWLYYWHVADRGGMPDVSIGDAFYLGSYVMWMAAAVPYLHRYGNLIGRGSRFALIIYGEVGAVVVYTTARYWYGAAQEYGYSAFATTVWLSYPVIAIGCLFFIAATWLLYGYEGYGRGLLTNYWFYFLIPIMMIAVADVVNGFYYVLSENSVPGRLDDMLYLAGYAVTIAAGVTIYRTKLMDKASVTPSVEEHLMKGNSVSIVRGRGHIIEDPRSTLSYDLFSRLMVTEDGGAAKRKGFVISRYPPDKVLQEFGVKGSPTIWLSTVAGEGTVGPTKLTQIAHLIMEFLSSSNEGVVLLDGVESIMVHNDFGKTLRMLQQINDFVMQYKGYLLIPIDPEAFDTRERALLQRDFETITTSREH